MKCNENVACLLIAFALESTSSSNIDILAHFATAESIWFDPCPIKHALVST